MGVSGGIGVCHKNLSDFPPRYSRVGNKHTPSEWIAKGVASHPRDFISP